MIDIGMSELLVVGTVALIVIGPKDLPELFRSLGRMTAKLRAMSREFSRAMEAAANESGMKDVADDLRKATSAKSMGLDAVKDAASKFEKWDPLKVSKPSGTVRQPTVATTQADAAKPEAAKADAPKVDAAPEAPAPAGAPETKAKAKPKGPATQALADAQAARKAVALEAAEKLKRPVVAATDTAAAAPAKKPRAPRKPKPKADA